MKNSITHLPTYKKTIFWVIAAVVAACILAAAFLLTRPRENAIDETDNITKQSIATLTLEDVLRLSKKGSDLTWEDFDCYHYMETGSGLYIRTYDIDDKFYLTIGSGGYDIQYIYLCYGFDKYIDIRDNDAAAVEKFIKELNEGDAASHEIPYHSSCFRVASADDGDAFDKMFELAENRYSPTMMLSCIQNLPVVEIHSRAELNSFCKEMSEHFEFTQPYDGIPAFSEAAEKYDEEFFKTNTLFLIYAYSSGSPEYPDVEFVYRHSSIALSIGIMCSSVTEQDTGWLIAVEVTNEDMTYVASVDSYVSSRMIPTTDMDTEND